MSLVAMKCSCVGYFRDIKQCHHAVSRSRPPS